MKLCVFGRSTDALSVHTADLARARGHAVMLVGFAELARGAEAWFDGAAWSWRGERVDACDAFVVRRYPDAHAVLGAPAETATAAEWWMRGTAQAERSTFAQSCIMDMELRGKAMVNPLLASSPFDHKPLQLATFARARLPIPRTLVTSDARAAAAFRAAVGECVAKPVGGGALARVVDDSTDLAPLASAPAIFQERVRGLDVRVTVVGARVVSSVVVDTGDADALDYRGTPAYLRDEMSYREHPLPAPVAAMCIQAAQLSHHVLSGVDLKKRGDDYVILEANSGPVYLDIEVRTGAPITQAILEHLEQQARHVR